MRKKTVWIVEGCWDYEGSTVVAVCNSEEKAQKKQKEVEGTRGFDLVTVTPFVVE